MFDKRRGTAVAVFLCGVIFMSVLAGCNRSPEARYARYLENGKKFSEKKDYRRAILEFKNALQAKPRAAEAYYQIGLASVPSGDYMTAVGAFRKTLEMDARHTGAQFQLAQLMSATLSPDILRDAESRLRALLDNPDVGQSAVSALALTELRLGKASDALKLLEEALAKSPGSWTQALLLAQVKLSQKDFRGAEEALKKVSESETHLAAPHIMLGELYASQNRVAEASAHFRRAVEIEPKSATALMDLGIWQRSQGKKVEAEEVFKRLAALGEQAYKPAYALFLFEEGRRDEAVREFERVFKENPDDRSARTRLVAAYQETNRMADARRVLDSALSKNAKDVDAILQRSELLRLAGNYERAEGDLNEALHLRPSSAEVHYVMAKFHETRHAVLSQRQELSEALRLNPYLLSARLELVQTLIKIDAAKTALEVLNATPEAQKNLPQVIAQFGWAYWTLGNMTEMRKLIDSGLARERSAELLLQDGVWKLRNGNAAGARASMEEALKVNPNDIRSLAVLSQTYSAQKQPAVALQKVKDFAAQMPKSAPIQEFLGLLTMANGDRKQARVAFNAAKAADPKYVKADLSLVQLDAAEGKLDDATGRLKTILATSPRNMVARLWLGNLEVVKEDHKAALENFRKVVEAEPDNTSALNNLAYLLSEYEKQPDEALQYAQKARDLAPDDAEFADTLGWVLYRKGLYTMAVKQLERAAAGQGNAVWKYHLAMAYAKAGDPTRGRATMEIALKHNPNLPEAKMARELLGQ